MFKFFAQWFSKQDKRQKIAEISLLTGAGVGLLASFILSIETLVLAKTPNTVLGCDLNAVISCSSVAQHWSASLLGFPNAFIGLMALPVMVTIAVALLAGAKFPKWFMQAAQAGAVIGMIFAIWMFYMSYIEIGVLCPWCLTLDLGILMIMFGLTRYNVLQKNISCRYMQKIVGGGYDALAVVSLVVAVIVAIITKFGSQLF